MYAPKRGAILLASALALAIVAPATQAQPTTSKEAFKAAERSGDLSKRLTPFAYFEEGEYFVAVDTRAAQYSKATSMVPIPIALANLTKTPISVNLEGFYLEAEDGTKYPVVAGESFSRDYNRSRADLRLKDSFLEALQGRFDQYPFQAWTPFPAAGEISSAQNSVELGRTFWTEATLYFPMPEDGIVGKKLSLVMSPDGGDKSYVVTFFVK